jgi:hypothetical protein
LATIAARSALLVVALPLPLSHSMAAPGGPLRLPGTPLPDAIGRYSAVARRLQAPIAVQAVHEVPEIKNCNTALIKTQDQTHIQHVPRTRHNTHNGRLHSPLRNRLII